MNIQYTHLKCGTVTTVSAGASEQYQKDPAWAADKFPQSPNFKRGTLCVACGGHQPRFVDGAHQFEFADGTPVTD